MVKRAAAAQGEWNFLKDDETNLPQIGKIVLVTINIPSNDRPAVYDLAYLNRKKEWVSISRRLISSEQIHSWAEIILPDDPTIHIEEFVV